EALLGAAVHKQAVRRAEEIVAGRAVERPACRQRLRLREDLFCDHIQRPDVISILCPGDLRVEVGADGGGKLALVANVAALPADGRGNGALLKLAEVR